MVVNDMRPRLSRRGAFRPRRTAAEASPANPTSSSAEVEGSGIAVKEAVKRLGLAEYARQLVRLVAALKD
jgi:hypothetical protein